jgi:hypothetical protein
MGGNELESSILVRRGSYAARWKERDRYSITRFSRHGRSAVIFPCIFVVNFEIDHVHKLRGFPTPGRSLEAT